ncbi:MAG: hypothetical protein Q9194_003496 [Teloschistes cf. exilis]
MTLYHQQSLPEPTHQLQHATSDVQNPSENPIPWDPSECLEYLVNVVGAQERLPQRVPFKWGSTGLVKRLGDRYGEDYLKSSCRVLRQFLENPTQGSTEERAIWHEWREGQAAKVESKWPRVMENQRVVLAWNDGSKSIWEDPNQSDFSRRTKGAFVQIKLQLSKIIRNPSVTPRSSSGNMRNHYAHLSATGLPL